MTLSSGTNVGILRSAPGHQAFACFVEQAKPATEHPPDFLACQVISDKEADNMELQEETESVDSTTDPTGLGGSHRPSVCMMKDDAERNTCSPSGDETKEKRSELGEDMTNCNKVRTEEEIYILSINFRPATNTNIMLFLS
jgi:hypothetical protein